MSILHIITHYLLPALVLGGPFVLLQVLKRRDKHLFLNFILMGSSLMLVLTLLYAGMNHYLLTTALADLGPNDHEMRTALHKELGSIHWASKGFISFVALGIPYLFTVYILRFAMHCLIAPNAAAQTEHEV